MVTKVDRLCSKENVCLCASQDMVLCVQFPLDLFCSLHDVINDIGSGFVMMGG